MFYVFGFWRDEQGRSEWAKSFHQDPYGSRLDALAHDRRRTLVVDYADWLNVVILPRNALGQFFTPSLPALMDDALEAGKPARVL